MLRGAGPLLPAVKSEPHGSFLLLRKGIFCLPVRDQSQGSRECRAGLGMGREPCSGLSWQQLRSFHSLPGYGNTPAASPGWAQLLQEGIPALPPSQEHSHTCPWAHPHSLLPPVPPHCRREGGGQDPTAPCSPWLLPPPLPDSPQNDFPPFSDTSVVSPPHGGDPGVAVLPGNPWHRAHTWIAELAVLLHACPTSQAGHTRQASDTALQDLPQTVPCCPLQHQT